MKLQEIEKHLGEKLNIESYSILKNSNYISYFKNSREYFCLKNSIMGDYLRSLNKT